MNKQKIAKVLLLLAIPLLNQPRPALSQQRYLWSESGTSGSQAPIWTAKDLGLFEKYGFDRPHGVALMLNEAFINLEGTKESLPAVTLFNMVKSYWVSQPIYDLPRSADGIRDIFADLRKR